MGKQVAAGFCGGVAQLGEHLPCKQGVKSSNLSISIQLSEKSEGWQLNKGQKPIRVTAECRFMHLKKLRFFRPRAGTLYISNSITAHECKHLSQF